MNDLIQPVDALHEECLLAQRRIRARYVEAKQRVARWQLEADETRES